MPLWNANTKYKKQKMYSAHKPQDVNGHDKKGKTQKGKTADAIANPPRK